MTKLESTAGPRLGLPSPRILAGARLLAALVPMADDDLIRIGARGGLPSPAILRGPRNRLSFRWTDFAQEVMAAQAPGEVCAPFVVAVGDRLRTLRLSTATIRSFMTGKHPLSVRWRTLISDPDEPLGDGATDDCPAEIRADGLLDSNDEAALRCLFQPLDHSAHETIEFEVALGDTLSGTPR